MYPTHDAFRLKCFMTPTCLLLIVLGLGCLVLGYFSVVFLFFRNETLSSDLFDTVKT